MLNVDRGNCFIDDCKLLRISNQSKGDRKATVYKGTNHRTNKKQNQQNS